MEKLKEGYKNALALKEVIVNSINSEDNVAGKYSSYPIFLMKFQEIRQRVSSEIDLSIIDSFDVKKIPNPIDQTWPQQKQIIDMIFMNLNLLISRLEIELNIFRDKINALIYFLEVNVRKGVLIDVTKEKDIQNVIETLLIGNGYEKGITYDREVGRVKVSAKESIPDFIFHKINLALEVKLATSTAKMKEIIDEINADIRAYSKEYKNLLFLVYDKGGVIRDIDEFKSDLETAEGTRVIIIKH